MTNYQADNFLKIDRKEGVFFFLDPQAKVRHKLASSEIGNVFRRYNRLQVNHARPHGDPIILTFGTEQEAEVALLAIVGHIDDNQAQERLLEDEYRGTLTVIPTGSRIHVRSERQYAIWGQLTIVGNLLVEGQTLITRLLPTKTDQGVAVPYAQLQHLIQHKQLIPGCRYKILDFQSYQAYWVSNEFYYQNAHWHQPEIDYDLDFDWQFQWGAEQAVTTYIRTGDSKVRVEYVPGWSDQPPKQAPVWSYFRQLIGSEGRLYASNEYFTLIIIFELTTTEQIIFGGWTNQWGEGFFHVAWQPRDFIATGATDCLGCPYPETAFLNPYDGSPLPASLEQIQHWSQPGGDWLWSEVNYPGGCYESLWLTALDYQTLSQQALSDLHPGDQIIYDPTSYREHPKGRIIYRYDSLTNRQANYDWRYIKNYRWSDEQHRPRWSRPVWELNLNLLPQGLTTPVYDGQVWLALEHALTSLDYTLAVTEFYWWGYNQPPNWQYTDCEQKTRFITAKIKTAQAIGGAEGRDWYLNPDYQLDLWGRLKAPDLALRGELTNIRVNREVSAVTILGPSRDIELEKGQDLYLDKANMVVWQPTMEYTNLILTTDTRLSLGLSNLSYDVYAKEDLKRLPTWAGQIRLHCHLELKEWLFVGLQQYSWWLMPQSELILYPGGNFNLARKLEFSSGQVVFWYYMDNYWWVNIQS